MISLLLLHPFLHLLFFFSAALPAPPLALSFLIVIFQSAFYALRASLFPSSTFLFTDTNPPSAFQWQRCLHTWTPSIPCPTWSCCWGVRIAWKNLVRASDSQRKTVSAYELNDGSNSNNIKRYSQWTSRLMTSARLVFHFLPSERRSLLLHTHQDLFEKLAEAIIVGFLFKSHRLYVLKVAGQDA